VSSRQEEKERRRRERQELEAAQQAKKARAKRLQFVFGGGLTVLVVAAIVVGVVVLSSSSGGGGSGTPKTANAKGVAIPALAQSDLKKAAAAANCTVTNPAIEGNTHESKDFKASDYKTNPPTSGNHNPVWYQDGEYNPGDTPKLGMLVHPLEHGRIELQYKVGTPSTTVKQLETLFNQESGGYHMLLFQNTTNMPDAVAATAWGHLLACKTMNDKVFDAVRDFHDAYINKGPEIVP
jgi:hypothetical protein